MVKLTAFINSSGCGGKGPMKYCYFHFFLVFLFCGFIFLDALSQEKITYTRSEAMIPMRDGVRLYTVIYSPRKISEPLPMLMVRTPYGSRNRAVSPDSAANTDALAAEGYIFITQDIRGRYESEGQFVMLRPNKYEPGEVDESTDTWDTIEWLLENIKNHNGRVGQMGVSYMGWTSLCSAANPHPAMKAVSEQATCSDMFLGDDFHHNGAFRLAYGFEYSYMTEAAKVNTFFPFDDYDQYTWFLNLGPLSNVNRLYFHDKIPTWNNYMQHPDYDDFWKSQSTLFYANVARIPILHVGGVWDQEDLFGPQLMYAKMEETDKNNYNYFCLGPWNHGMWTNADATSIGAYRMGSNTSAYFQQEIQKKWFDYWLKGKGDGRFPEAITFQTGNNRWQTFDSWPPSNAVKRALYLREGGKVSFDRPDAQDARAYDEYVSDPKKPVPYRSRPIETTYGPGSRWDTWLVEDQRFVEGRPDVLTWKSEVLTEDLTVTGTIVASLFASTSGSDADWVVKLIDVYPGQDSIRPAMGGYQLMIASEVLRARYRNSFEKPEPLIPEKVEEYTIDLHQVNHTFLMGHCIMVQVQSSWFPIIDMNPQQYVKSIYDAISDDYKKAVQRVFRNSAYPSCIVLPVMK